MAGCRFCEMLSDFELECVIPKLGNLLQTATTPETAVNEEQIQANLALKGLFVPNERMRIMIAYIRINGLVPLLMYGPTGFFTTQDFSLIMDQVSAIRFISVLMNAEADSLEQQTQITTH